MNAAPQRRAAAAAAAAASVAVMGTVLLMFGQASRDEWLAGTDAQLAAWQRCQAAAAASSQVDRGTCARELRLASRASREGAARVARVEGAAEEPR